MRHFLGFRVWSGDWGYVWRKLRSTDLTRGDSLKINDRDGGRKAPALTAPLNSNIESL